MAEPDFTGLTDEQLIVAAHNERLGLSRAFAIEELVKRASRDPNLVRAACAAISSDRRIRSRMGIPVGWLGADWIYLSGQEHIIRRLLEEMASWDAIEQEDLIRHWAGNGKLAALSRELEQRYGFVPRYKVPA